MRFRVSGPLLRFVDYRREVEITAVTVDEALQGLAVRFPGLRRVLYDAAGCVRPTHRLFLNQRQLGPDEIQQSIEPDDTVEILTAIAGG